MPGLGTWTAGATIVAAGTAIVTLGGTLLFRAGVLWERMHGPVDPSEPNREGDGCIPADRFEHLLEAFQTDELTLREAEEFLGYLDDAIARSRAANRPAAAKKLHVIRRGVESAVELRKQGLHA